MNVEFSSGLTLKWGCFQVFVKTAIVEYVGTINSLNIIVIIWVSHDILGKKRKTQHKAFLHINFHERYSIQA